MHQAPCEKDPGYSRLINVRKTPKNDCRPWNVNAAVSKKKSNRRISGLIVQAVSISVAKAASRSRGCESKWAAPIKPIVLCVHHYQICKITAESLDQNLIF